MFRSVFNWLSRGFVYGGYLNEKVSILLLKGTLRYKVVPTFVNSHHIVKKIMKRERHIE